MTEIGVSMFVVGGVIAFLLGSSTHKLNPFDYIGFVAMTSGVAVIFVDFVESVV